MTVKMMGVIYRAFKEGKLEKTSAADIEKAYYFVKLIQNEIKFFELKNYHNDAFTATMNLKEAVDAIFAGDYEKADNLVSGFETVQY